MPSGAAAALLAAALPKNPTSNHPDAHSGRGRGRARRIATAARGANMDEDIGMSDSAESSGRGRRGRQARSGPMGERPNRSRNSPAVLSDKRSSSAPSSSAGGPKTRSTDPTSTTTIDALRLFLLGRYVEEAKMLNLERMAEDPVLKEHGLLAPGQPGAPSNMAGAMWKLAKEMFPSVITISLAHNDLSSLLPLSPFLLTSSLPHVQNVSFANNNLGHFRDLDPFSPTIGKERKDRKPKGWSKLQELVLKGNPVVHSGGTEQTYEREMARRFSNLQQLDQKPLDPAIAFAVAQTASTDGSGPGLAPKVKSERAKAAKREVVQFPLEFKGVLCDVDQTREFVGGFFGKFFETYDSSRENLLPAYAPSCSFSLHADTAYPARARAKKIGINGDKRFPHQHKLDWKNYLTAEGSRNLQRVKSPEKRLATLKVNPASVVSYISTLPKTKHPLDQSDKFTWDAWTMENMIAPQQPGAAGETVIYATVHGEFQEFPSKGIRSFDRTFILAPAPPGSPAQQAGWPCLILSDLLTLRGYSDLSFSKSKPPPAPPAPSAGPASTSVPVVIGSNQPPPIGGALPVPVAAPPVQERAEGITDEQQSLVLQLQQVTRLTYTFSHLCLSQNNWDPHQALAQFQTLQAQGGIPAEAFVAI